MTSKANFDFVAPVYDTFARMIFGTSIRASHHVFLDQISPSARVLVLGGGTGEFLPAFFANHPEAQVYFIDSSARMILRARKRLEKINARIIFVTGTEKDIPPGVQFDAVITFFYLDLFGEIELQNVIGSIRQALQKSAVWLAADFTDNGKWWQHTVLTAMYLFFRFSAGLRTSALPDWKKQLESAGLVCLQYKSFFRGFIESRCYRF